MRNGEKWEKRANDGRGGKEGKKERCGWGPVVPRFGYHVLSGTPGNLCDKRYDISRKFHKIRERADPMTMVVDVHSIDCMSR